MDKQKMPPGPRPRVKRTALPPGDFIALGKSSASKPRTPSEVESKQLQTAPRKPILSTSVGSSGLQKRKEAIPILNPVPPKRSFSPFSSRAKDNSKVLDTGDPVPPVKLVDAASSELEDLIIAADIKNDFDLVDGLICGAIKTLKINRLKPDPMLYLTLVNIANTNPTWFTSKRVIEHLLQFLRRENTISSVKPKPNTLLSIMTCSILQNTFQNEETWPQSFMKVYVDDALGDRAWVDNESNKDFVNNITAVFGTNLPPKLHAAPSIFKSSAVESSHVTIAQSTAAILKEEETILEEGGISLEASESISVQNRYSLHKDEAAIQAYIHDIVKDLLNKRQMIDSVSRNLLRFLTSVCGYVEVRLMASHKLETWLQNPKLARPAQELLMSVAMNCNTHSQEDMEVIANIVRMRLKAKPVINQYVNSIKELISQHDENLGTILKHVIYNELSQQRNPLNMAVLGVIFTNEPDLAAKYLSMVFQDLLTSREDYLRVLRGLFREIVRSLKFEVNLVEFCRGLMQDRHEVIFSEMEQPYKDRMYVNIIDLICMGSFLCISPIVKEQALSLVKNEKRDYSVLQACQTQISTIQRDAIWFFHTKVMKMYNCNERDFVLGLKKVLFLESNEQYASKDNWPSEADKTLFLQIVQEVPLAEDGLLRLHLLGLSDDLPINCADTLDLIERMVLRAAVLKVGLQGIVVERIEVLNMLLSLSAYSHPRDIPLPNGYTPPSLAINNLYWKAWLVLIILAATNPTTVGLKVWETYPTARCLMEMLITGCYEFPPLNVGNLTSEEIKANELQLRRAEKDDILVFEGHLAAATSRTVINEANSLLISQLLNLDPSGAPRKPPSNIVDRLKNLNDTFQLGKLLCQSRKPDFLLSIIESQGSSKSMPWLADLVQSSETSLDALPVQCLCEFLLMNFNQNIQTKHKSIKPKVASRLQELLMGSEATAHSSTELIKYFIQRWASPEMIDRESSIDAFQSIMLLQKKRKQSVEDDMGDEERHHRKHNRKMLIVKDSTYTWLHDRMTQLPYFNDALKMMLTYIRQSLNVETNIYRLQAYILFVRKFYSQGDSDFLSLLIHDLSVLVVHRNPIMKQLLKTNKKEKNSVTHEALLEIFATYLKCLLKNEQDGSMSIDEDNERVTVAWHSPSHLVDQTIETHLSFIQASMMLLTYDDVNTASYDDILAAWINTKNYDVFINGSDQEINILDNELLRKLFIYSNIEVLVTEGFCGIGLKELVNLLDRFGMPNSSWCRLLSLLDDAAVNTPDEVISHVKHKDKAIHLVELAMDSGCTGGVKFCALLRDDYMYENEARETIVDVACDLSVIEISWSNDKMTTTSKPKSLILSQPLDYSGDDVTKVLQSYFMGDTKEVSAFITLKQKLSLANIKVKDKENKLALKIINSLNLFLTNRKFVHGFIRKSNDACALLRLLSICGLTCYKEKYLNLFIQIKESLPSNHAIRKLSTLLNINLECIKNTTKSCNTMMMDILNNKDSNENINLVKELMDKLREGNDLNSKSKDKLIQVLVLLSKQSIGLLEELIQLLFELIADQKKSRIVLDILLEVLVKGEPSAIGLLLDWISMIDSEILQFNPIVERDLLFGNHGCQLPSITYLTSLLAHQTKSVTLEDCLTWMLSSERNVDSMNAKACLTLINCMVNNSKLWQGRENKDDQLEQNNTEIENQGHINLKLTVHQVYRLIEFILSLIKTDQEDGKIQQDIDSEISEKHLPLLLIITNDYPHVLKKAVKLITQRKRFGDEVISCFLRHLYLQRPILLRETQNDLTVITPPNQCKAKIDDLIHRLITSIADPQGSTVWEEKFTAISSINRRLAVEHPLIFRRQLPLLLSIMKGKNRMTSSQFSITNQLMFCNHVVGLFDILKPHVFEQNEECRHIMEMYVDGFLEIIMSTCLKHDACTSLVNKFVEFLNHYISSGNTDCESMLKKHENIFSDLMYDFPNFEELTTICTFITSAACQPTLITTNSTPWPNVQLDAFKRRLTTDHQLTDLMNVLHDLDESSKHRVDILINFLDELSLLAHSPEDQVRQQTMVLLLRYLRYDPSSSGRLSRVLEKCLTDSNPEIVSTVSHFLPQLLMFSNEKASEIMKKMYHISTTTRMQLEKDILKTIHNLNIDCES